MTVKFLCDTLPHMSICTWIVVTITFQKVNHAPHTQASAQGDHQGLEHFDCAVEKFHRQLLAGISILGSVMCHRHTKAGTVCRPYSGLDSGILLFSKFCGDCPLCTPGPPGRQLRRIDGTPPFSAEHHSLSAPSISYTSQTSLALSFSRVDRKRSMSKVFFSL